jgi:hypothetical protein
LTLESGSHPTAKSTRIRARIGNQITAEAVGEDQRIGG